MKEFKVIEFSYNGFMGMHNSEKIMDYTAIFREWTRDGGIAIFECSDGKLRLIPTYALVDMEREDLPEQPIADILFGLPCSNTSYIDRQRYEEHKRKIGTDGGDDNK